MYAHTITLSFWNFTAQLTVVSDSRGSSQKCSLNWYGDEIGVGLTCCRVTKRQTAVSQREPSELDYAMVVFSCWGFKLCRHLLLGVFSTAFLSSSLLQKGMLETCIMICWVGLVLAGLCMARRTCSSEACTFRVATLGSVLLHDL